MTSWFADTFYLIALLNSDDEAHARAAEFAQAPHGIVTTSWILTEFADGLADTPARQHFLSFINRFRANPRTAVIPATEEILVRAMRLYDERPDKEWSLTDCTSFIVMGDLGLTEALTGDHHFEQAGFMALLKP